MLLVIEKQLPTQYYCVVVWNLNENNYFQNRYIRKCKLHFTIHIYYSTLYNTYVHIDYRSNKHKIEN